MTTDMPLRSSAAMFDLEIGLIPNHHHSCRTRGTQKHTVDAMAWQRPLSGLGSSGDSLAKTIGMPRGKALCGSYAMMWGEAEPSSCSSSTRTVVGKYSAADWVQKRTKVRAIGGVLGDSGSAASST